MSCHPTDNFIGAGRKYNNIHLDARSQVSQVALEAYLHFAEIA